MAKTVTLGSANLLTAANAGGAQKIAFIYLKTAVVKTAQKLSWESTENKNKGNKLWYPLTDCLLSLQKSLLH